MKHRTTSLLLTGVLGLGGLAAGAVVAPAIAVAQTSDTSAAAAVSDRVAHITEALSGLVGDGTITEAQAGQVATTLAEQLPGRDGQGRRGHGGGGMHLAAAAEVLGIDEAELRTALEGGQSLAGVAEAQGVEEQALVDSLVTAANERIDAKLAAGDLTQAEADEKKAAVVERITALVAREGLPARGDRGPRPSGDTSGDTSADTAAEPSTDTTA